MNASASDFDTDEPLKDEFNGSDQSGKEDEPLSGEAEPSEDAELIEKAEAEDVDAEIFNTDYPSSEGGSNKSSSVATLPPLGSHRQARGFAGGDPSDPRNWPNIDGYIIEAYLGGGGFGTVYRAHSTKLDATVAVKVLKPEVLHRPDAVKRFSQEVTTAARNRHLHVVQVLDTGVIKTASHERCQYMVTEFLAGGDFLGWLSEHPRTSRGDGNLRLAIEKLVQICRGLESLHQAGIVHRDIKPENVLLDQDGSPKLADFGLAGIFDEKLAEARSGKIQLPLPDDMENSIASRLTVTGDVFGTLGYMAPELFMGMQHASPASDQFSIGVMLYVILCDLRPFQAKRRDPEERVRIQQAIDNLDRQLPPPSIEPPSSKGNFRDRGLQFICMKCLRPAPELRYSDVAELRSDLEAWLSGQTVGEGRLTQVWNEKIYLPVKNRPFRYLASVAAILIVVSLGFIFKNRLEYEAELLGTNNELSETNQQLETTNQSLTATQDKLKLESEKLQRQLLQSFKVAGEQAAAAGNYGDTALAYAAAWQLIDTIPNHTQSDEEAIKVSHAVAKRLSPSLVEQRSFTPGNLSFQTSHDGQFVVVLDNSRVKLLELARLLPLRDGYRQQGPVSWIQISSDNKKLLGIGSNFENAPICYVWDLFNLEIFSQSEITFAVNHAAFYAEGTKVAICGSDMIDGTTKGVLEIRDASTLEVTARQVFDLPAIRIAVDDDGERLACVLSSDKSRICMHEGADASKIWDIEVPGNFYCALNFSPDGTRLAAATNNGTAVLVQCPVSKEKEEPVVLDLTRTMEKDQSFDLFGRPLSAAKFSSDGTTLATICGGNSVQLWDSLTGRSLGDPLVHPNLVTDVDIHPKRAELLTACTDELARVWSIPSGAGNVAKMRHAGVVLSAGFGFSGTEILTAGEDGIFKKWTYQLPQPLAFGSAKAPIQSVVNADASKVVTQAAQGVFRVWSLSDGTAVGPEFQVDHPVHRISLAGDDDIVALAGLAENSEGLLSLVDQRTGELKGEAITFNGIMLAMHFSPDRKWLAFISSTREKHTLNSVELGTRANHEIPLVNPDRITWNPAEPSQLLVGVRNGSVHEMQLPDLAPKLLPVHGDSQVFRALQFSADGKYLATTTGDGVKIWTIAGWNLLGSSLTHGGSEPNGVAFSPTNESHLISYGNDGAAIKWKWDTETKAWLQLDGVFHRAPVNSVEFSADGNFFATASDDATARVWTHENCEPYGVPFLHHTELNGLVEVQSVKFIKGSNDLITFTSNYKGLLSVLPWEMIEQHNFGGQRASDSTLRPLLNRSAMQVWRWTANQVSENSEEAMQQAQLKERRKIDSSGRIVRLSRDETRELLKSAAVRSEEPLTILIELASQARADENWNDLIRYLEPVLSAEPELGSLWYDYGLAQRKIGKKDEAFAAFGRAISDGYQTSKVYLARAKLLAEFGRFEEALTDSQIALNTSLVPDEAAFQIGYCHASLNDFNAANEAYRMGIEAALKFGVGLDFKRLYEYALLQLVAAPESADPTFLQSYLELVSGASDFSACYFAAFAASVSGGDEVDWVGVVELAKTAYELEPEITNTKLCLAYALSRGGRHDEASRSLKEAIGKLEAEDTEQPVNPLPLFFHAITLHSLGRVDDALAALRRGEELLDDWNSNTDPRFIVDRYGWSQRIAFGRLRDEARKLLGQVLSE